MTQQIDYKGYEIISIQNGKIVAQISNNIFPSEKKTDFGNKLFHEPPIKFKFSGYDAMVKFIDENPR